MKATGTIEITEELTLKNPNLTIKKLSLELIFKEDGSELLHSRTFDFEVNKENFSEIDVLDLTSKNDILKLFK
jgi:hypothetical protein